MSWTRFHYLCRSTAASLAQGSSPAAAIQQAEEKSYSYLYGDKLSSGSTPYRLKEELLTINNRESMQAAAQTYSQINFSALETKTRKYNDAGSYLIATASLYIFISFLFRMKVYPTIETIFSNADITPSTNFIWLMANWELITGITTGFLFLCFAFSYPIKHIRDFSSDISDKLLYKIFLPSSIRTSYSNILDILRFPLGSTGGTSASPYIASLTDAAKHSQNSLCEEINILLTLEVKKLEKQCDRLNKAILSMAAIVIVLSICLFLQTTYSTIFLLGNIV